MGSPASFMGALRVLAFGISPEETSFARRGFRAATQEARERLEGIGRVFVDGYHAALRAGVPDAVEFSLDRIAPDLRGFAFEGASMGFSILDIVTPWRADRVVRFLAGEGTAHGYMIHVGMGWALARLRRPIEPALARADPLLGWLVVDGYGFHEGYFHHDHTVGRQVVPKRLRGYALRAFDQGVGRSLWFAFGAGVDDIAATVGRFPAERRGDLWSGVGLACTYAGGASRSAMERLPALAGEHAAHVAQGAAFGAKARQRGGNLRAHTEAACLVLCGCSAARAAAVTDDALAGLQEGGDDPAYETWRRRVRAALRMEISPS